MLSYGKAYRRLHSASTICKVILLMDGSIQHIQTRMLLLRGSWHWRHSLSIPDLFGICAKMPGGLADIQPKERNSIHVIFRVQQSCVASSITHDYVVYLVVDVLSTSLSIII